MTAVVACLALGASLPSALAHRPAARASALPPPTLIYSSSHPLQMVASVTGDAALLVDGLGLHQPVMLWRNAVRGLQVLGRGSSALAVSGNGRWAAYDCGTARLIVCIWHSGGHTRRIGGLCLAASRGLPRAFVSEDARTALIGCQGPGSYFGDSSALVHIGPRSLHVTPLHGFGAVGLSPDGNTALLVKERGSAVSGYLDVNGTLTKLPAAEGLMNVSPSLRYVLLFINSTTQGTGTVTFVANYELYDTTTGSGIPITFTSSPPGTPAGWEPDLANDSYGELTDDGNLVLYKANGPGTGCSIGIVNLHNSAYTQLATCSMQFNSIFPTSLSADGTKAFYIASKPVPKTAPTVADDAFEQTVP